LSPDAPRIGYVLKVYPRLTETFILTELLAHQRAGQDIEIFSLRPPGDGRFHEAIGELRFPVTYVPSAGLHTDTLWEAMHDSAGELAGTWAALADAGDADARDAYQALWLAREARRRGIRHLHAHFASAAGMVSRIAARAGGLNYSLTTHAKDIFHEDVNARALRSVLGDARAAVTVSDFNVAHLRGAAPAARVQRVYNGLHIERFPFSPPADRAARILAVGRLIEKKGFGDLVDACALLAAQGRRFGCDIVGSGPLAGALAARIAEHGLRDTVRLLGPYSQDEVQRAIRGAAVMAAPCVVGSDGNRDGLPTVLLEAMALGTPCVATRVTGIPEAIEDERTGLLVAERRPAQLAGALARMLDDASLRVCLAGAARARVEERFDADRNAARLRAVAWGVRAGGHVGETLVGAA
jgi:colanic acid/amylovoran biosynthesis glycosyltransferase